MNVHKNAYSGSIKKRIERSDLKESGASRSKDSCGVGATLVALKAPLDGTLPTQNTHN